MTNTTLTPAVKIVARIGLTAKGVVYCLLGTLAFMAAFELGGEEPNKKGVFELIEGAGGKILLGLLVIGLFCYIDWRVVQAITTAKQETDTGKKTGKIIRYVFSALAYLSVALYALKRLLGNEEGGGDNTQNIVSQLLDKPFGQWLVGLLGLILAATGIYQIWYGLSEKYKKHVEELNLHSTASRSLLTAGKIGYVARGIVWLIISWLLLKAAAEANPGQAGDTGKAFQFLENASFGSYMLGALGIGLICYGAFNFIRAKYESFGI